jgi:hypothetical protein
MSADILRHSILAVHALCDSHSQLTELDSIMVTSIATLAVAAMIGAVIGLIGKHAKCDVVHSTDNK